MATTQRHRRASVLIMGALAFAAAPALLAQTGDAAAGRKKAHSCATCHGPTGISRMPNTPHLAGQPAIYLVEQLKAYRSGTRTDQVMNVVAKPLSDLDINDLAAWYTSIELSAKPVP